MTPQEFKAWFDGYSEHIADRPSKKQWDRIVARVAEINGVATTYPVFVDRYWPAFRTTEWRPMGAPIPYAQTSAPMAGVLWNGPVNADGSPAPLGSCVAHAMRTAAESPETAMAKSRAQSFDFDPFADLNTLGRTDALADA